MRPRFTVTVKNRYDYSASTDRTYLRSDQIDFEVYLQGDYHTTLTNHDMIW